MKLSINEFQQEEIAGLTDEYPYVYHAASLNGTTVPWHWHEELELGYVTNGTLGLTTLNKHYKFHPHEAFFINTNVLCTMESASHDRCTLFDSHLFNAILLGAHYKSIYMTKYLNPILYNKNIDIIEIRGKSERQKKMLNMLRKLSLLQKTENTEFPTRNLLSELWLLLLDESRGQEHKKMPKQNVSQERLQSMLSFIHRHYEQKITLTDIAASAAVGERECLRCFQNGIKKSPIEYLMEYRVEKAVQMMNDTDLPLIDIAIQNGFHSGAYFGKVFKRMKNQTPGEYRRKDRL